MFPPPGPEPWQYILAEEQQENLADMRRRGAAHERAHGGVFGLFRADLDHHRHCPDSCRSKADFAESRRKSWWR
jgi:hypothetical protein